MARGWESKGVEEQQAEAAKDRSAPRISLSPNQRAAQRQREGLLLSRQRVLKEMEVAQNPAHRGMLQKALADLDARLAQLG